MFMTIDCQVINEPAAHAWVLDPEVLRRPGLFETLRVYSGRAFEVEAHIRRMQSSAKKLGLRMAANVGELVQQEVARAAASGLTEAFVRITLGQDPETASSRLVTVVESLPALEPRWYSGGMRVATASERRNEFGVTAGMKTTALLAEILAFRERHDSHIDDMLFFDSEGHFSEASASNIFFCVGGTLMTPPESCGALPGITRRIVSEIALAAGIPVVSNRPNTPDTLCSASELFLTSSIREIVPVISVDGAIVGDGLPGPVFKQMRTEYTRVAQCTS